MQGNAFVPNAVFLGGFALVWTALSLAKCRTPLGFLLAERRAGARGALVMGLRRGAFCTLCCRALMALLFVGGVMNLPQVAALAGLVLLEKIGAERWHVESLALAWGSQGSSPAKD